ncbi:MAG: error-prone DNA polymerase, partial [Rhodobacteraceae bacterium]|nr:error-prone DNA polymerase [Paracoccaceae bacterium]
MTGYAELCVTSNFTFLTGASHPEELVTRAAELGLDAVAITDRNSLAGVVRAHVALRELARMQQESGEGPRVRSFTQVDTSSRSVEKGAPLAAGRTRLPRLVIGARLCLQDSTTEVIALPREREAYARLSQLLSLGKRRAPKGQCHLFVHDLTHEVLAGMELIALVGETPDNLPDILSARLAGRAGAARLHLGAAPRYDGKDRGRFRALARRSAASGLPLVAVGDVLMHHGSRRALADVLTCLREGLTIDALGTRALPNAERRLRSAEEMAHLFREHPAALANSLAIAARCRFSLDDLSYRYPSEVGPGETAQQRLERLVAEGIPRRLPQGLDDESRARIAKEIRLIEKMRIAPYFLTVHDIMVFARSKGILCQGRGSAANSLVCYMLGITEVPPGQTQMVFERFVSEARGEPPDIDVDFEHERREEVIQWIYQTYGRHRAGLTATVIHFRSRAAVREVGKVMGISQDILAAIAGQSWGWSSSPPDTARLGALGLDIHDRRLRLTLSLIAQIIGFPRHLSQHVGGFVITEDRLDALCPIENAAMEDRTIIEWDKDDIDALHILKVDVLALGMLTAIRKCFALVRQHQGPDLSIPAIPQGDTTTYDMLCRADSIGVFQVESRAQINFLPRMRPREFYDLVIEVAIVRPGPIQGGMVHPYIKRRQRLEPVSFPSEALRGVLGKTLGVPLFQEQAMQIAVVGAGFAPEEADRLRRSMATFRRMGTISQLRERFIAGMLANGYEPAFAESCFGQIEGFGEYGFPESHAASFAILVYVSAFLKRHHPAAFTCALMNSQPMGFYAPAQLIRDLREHGVEVRPVSVNHSLWDSTLERRADGALALRIGLRQIKGLNEADAERICAHRGNGYSDVEGLWLKSGASRATLEQLAEADALASLGLTRRQALWQVRALAPKPLPLFSGQLDGEAIPEAEQVFSPMTEGQEVVEDYVSTRLSLRNHPMALLRDGLPGTLRHSALATAPRRVTVAGLVITRQRPGTASGVIFITLEDETG